MNAIALVRDEAAVVASKAAGLAEAARELVSFWETEPELAARAAVEMSAFEARAILRKGRLGRIAKETVVTREDFDDLARLETVTALAEARIGSLEASLQDSGLDRLVGLAGAASTLLGFAKMIF